LLAVANGSLGIVVDLDQEPVRSCRDGGARQWNHLVAHAGGVAWIHDDRKVAQGLGDRDGIQIERVPRVGLVGADSALAHDDPVVPAGNHVLRAHEPLVDRGR
jgi:hypothetical protein